MKTLTLTIFALALFYSPSAAAMHIAYSQLFVPAAAAAEPAAQPSGFETSPEWSKIGESLQTAWLAAKSSGDMSQKLECFVRVEDPFDPGDADFLQSNGFNVRSSGGDIVRGNVTAANLQSVAKLPFVRKIDLATK